MAYVGERLYDEFIRRRMADLATKVKVREIIPHLPCLTTTDREEIEAKREIAGNYNAMTLLLDNLRRRENWPDQFISALRKCEQPILADEISEACDRIKGIPKRPVPAPVPAAASVSVDPAERPVPAPVPAAASVFVDPAKCPAPAPVPAAATPSPFAAEAVAIPITATIHSVPTSNLPLLTTSVEALTPATTVSHPRPYSNIEAPAVTETPSLVSAPDAAVHLPPESAHPAEPPLLVSASRSPCSVSAPPLIKESEVPVSAGETSKLVVSGASAPINSPLESYFNTDSAALTETPATVSALEASVQLFHGSAHSAEPPPLVVAPHAVPPSPVSAPKLTPSIGQSEVPVSCTETATDLTNAAHSGPPSVAVPTLPTNSTSTSSQSNKPVTASLSSASPEKSKVVESSVSVKHPIQDSSPLRTVIPTDSQVVEQVNTAAPPNVDTQVTSQGTAQALPSTPQDTTAQCLANLVAENEGNFTKPGVLRGEEPCSVNSDLQISHMTTEHSPAQQIRPQALPNQNRADEPVVGSVSVTTDNLMISSSTTTVAAVENSFHRALENGSAEGDNFYLNQPVEDHYESSCQSFQSEQETREHLIEFSERPSIQNLSGQPSSMVGPTTIGLKHQGETESLVQSVSDIQSSLHKQTQCIQENNSSEQATLEPVSAIYQELELNKSSQINNPRPEQGEESQGVLQRFKSNLHLIGAAAIGIIAVFLVLKLKH